MSAELSGRVDQIEERLGELEAVVIDFPSSADWEALSSLSSSRFNELQSSISTVSDKVSTLEQYVVNLKMSHIALNTLFNTHTGQPAASGHNGLN